MLAANAYDIQMHLDTRDPALSLVDGRTIADPFRYTGTALTTLRLRAKSLRPVEETPSLRERLLAALPFLRGKARTA